MRPYKVLWYDPTQMMYQLDLRSSKAHDKFNVTQLKLYTGEPSDAQRRLRVSLMINEDNLMIHKILGHQFKHNNGLQFLCQFKDYAVEDAICRNATDFVEPAACILVAKYLRTLKNIPDDLGLRSL
jgi:hypothetical protein